MININGISVPGGIEAYLQATKDVLGLALDQSIANGCRIKLDVTPGMGIVTMMSELATNRNMKFRDIRMVALTPMDIRPLTGVIRQGKLVELPADPLSILGLAAEDRAVIVLNDFEGAHPEVIDYLGGLVLPGKVFVEVRSHGAREQENQRTAKALTINLLRRVGFKL